MKSLVCKAQYLELNPFLYGQPMKYAANPGKMATKIGNRSTHSHKCIWRIISRLNIQIMTILLVKL